MGAWKIPYGDRDVAHAVLTAEDDRGFFNIIGANDDPNVALGAPVTYRVELTDEEATRFRRASNARYVELDVEATRDDWQGAGATVIPARSSMTHMRAAYPILAGFDGRDVPVAILDGGITTAVATYMGWTVLDKEVFGPDAPGGDEITDDHGCLVAPCGVPDGGLVYDAVVSSNAGTTTGSAFAAAVAWVADQGCKILNYSFSGPTGGTVYTDAIEYAQARGLQIVCSAGNDGLTSINFPARYSTTYPNVHSSIAWNENTDTRPSFSNRAAGGSGCAPGNQVYGLTPAAAPVLWNGTSASAPHMARLIAMGCTGGQRTAAQVAAALRSNTRPTGQPASEQGAGAWDLHRALTALGLLPAPSTGADEVQIVSAAGVAASTNAYEVPGGSFQTGDLRVVTVSAGSTVTLPTPAGWERLIEQSDGTSLRIWVFAKTWAPGEPSTVFDFDTASSFFSSLTQLVLRSASGPIDPETVVPIMKFGTTTSVASTVTWPERANDILAAAFIQRDAAAPSGTLTLPAGLTSRGFWRPSSGTTGHKQLLATVPLTAATEAGPWVSTSNTTGANAAVIFTVASPAVAASTLPAYVRDVRIGALDAGQVIVERPDGVIPGDVLLAISSTNDVAVGSPDGWEQVTGAASPTVDTTVLVWRRVAGQDEPGSYTFPADAATSATVAVIALDQEQVGGGWDIVPVLGHFSVHTSTTTPVAQSLSPTSVQALNLALFAPRELTSGHVGHTPPAGMAEIIDHVPAGAAPQRGLHVAGEMVPAGATGTRTATRQGSATGYLSAPLALVAVPLPPIPVFREGRVATAQQLNDAADLIRLMYGMHHGGLRTRRPMIAARGAAATISNNTATVLSWASEDYDTAAFLTAPGTVWTVPDSLGGEYRTGLTAGLATAGTATTSSVIRVWIELNSTSLVARAEGAMPSDQPSAATCGALLRLEPGDQLRFWISHTGGASVALATGVTRATLRRIGP